MSLMDDYIFSCVMLAEDVSDDGEGGATTVWAEGETFRAAIAFDTSREMRAAEKQGAKSLFTVTTHKPFVLHYHDVFKRLSDGKVFRVISDGNKQTPQRATFQLSQVTAEEYTLPDGGVTT